MTEPNFFIVGAPKAGTTALSRYLSDHAQVFVTDPKELFYFCSDFSNLPGPRREPDYLAHFSEAKGARAVGEATAMYLYSQVAIERIHARHPEAKLIVMLREPVSLARSFHAQQRYGRSEDVESFREAWHLQAARRAGQRLPKRVREPAFLQYRDVAMLGDQVARLLQIVPRNRVHFTVFDDLQQDPRSVYTGVLEFLGVDDDGRTDFQRENERKEVRHERLADWLNRPPPWVSAFVARGKRALGFRPGDVAVLDSLRRWNSRTPSDVEPLPEFEANLTAEFRDDVARLSELVGRDLTRWSR